MGKELKVEVGTTIYTFEIEEATTITGMKRNVFRGVGRAYYEKLVKDSKENSNGKFQLSGADLNALFLVAEIMYPDVMAVTSAAKKESFDEDGKLLGEEDLMGLPVPAFADMTDAVTVPWSELVYQVNPHWTPSFNQEDNEGKEKRSESS